MVKVNIEFEGDNWKQSSTFFELTEEEWNSLNSDFGLHIPTLIKMFQNKYELSSEIQAEIDKHFDDL